MTTDIVGKLEKPFHRPECMCNNCVEWCSRNALSKSQKRNLRRRRAARRLAGVFRAAFSSRVFDPDSPKPLIVGVREKLLQAMPDIPVNRLERFLSHWCHRKEYIAAIAADDSYRYHLSGHRGRKVSDRDRQYAVKQLRFRRKKSERSTQDTKP